MAQITNPNITSQIAALANTGTIDSNAIVQLLNSALPATQQIATTGTTGTGLYKRFGEFDKVNAKIEVVTTGLWSNDSGSLTALYTASSQTTAASGKYYYNILNSDPNIGDSEEVQFAVAYGHVDGSGSVRLNLDDNALLPTKSTYAQYKSMLLDPTVSKFKFDNSSTISTDANGVYFINVARNRYREKMDAGNWSLKLSGSNGVFTFIDNSGKKFGDTLGLSGNVFKVVSGSLELGTQSEATIKHTADVATDLKAGYSATGEGFGEFYPDRGIIVLNAKAIGNVVGNVGEVGFQNTGSLQGGIATTHDAYNHKLLYYAIKKGEDFEARRTENVSTQHFFVRATNREFNYSNNPTYLAADGTFTETSFNTDPQTYITTVGLLNDSNELVAIAKTSQPIVKSFDKEVLIKVKLSF